MRGTLYGIGVGCGDPMDMTVKAIETIKGCEVVAVPISAKDNETVALNIAEKMVADIRGKEMLYLDMPMTRDTKKLDEMHDLAAQKVCEILEKGQSVAFLTLGDPTVYSTYTYVHKRVLARGYPAQIISGITSFTAVAARLNISLTERGEALFVLPASYDGIEETLDLNGTKILMKTGKKIEKIKDLLKEKGIYENAMMIEKCGMEGEVIHKNLDSANENSSYFSVVIIKGEQND